MSHGVRNVRRSEVRDNGGKENEKSLLYCFFLFFSSSRTDEGEADLSLEHVDCKETCRRQSGEEGGDEPGRIGEGTTGIAGTRGEEGWRKRNKMERSRREREGGTEKKQ